MKLIPRIVLIGAACLVASCGKKESPEIDSRTTAGYSTPGSAWKEADFTKWMSRAELQFLQDGNPADEYFAHVEGRNDAGRIEYRAVLRPFPAEQYDQWAVFWGISETELFDWELRLLKTGFSRQDIQVFTDSAGKALYQIVWLKNKDQPIDPDKVSAGAEPTIAGQSTLAKTDIQPAAEVPEAAVADAPVERLVAAAPYDPNNHSMEAPATTPRAVVKETKDTPPVAKPVGKSSIYVVKPGDTLGKVAKLRGISVSDLKAANSLKSDNLRIGQKLTIIKK